MLMYTWKPILVDGEPAASLQCPECKQWATLGGEIQDHIDAGGHTMDADGNVSPSIVCPWKPCEWHQMVTLVGWPDSPLEIC